ncbi:hypothetical protein SEA_DAUDAU_61 [Streptomyces phage Daudau]|uniref:Uncharacterized protein n=1 Tax=Streptomyces phage Daudau TaxID=2041206 RepID=A0A291LH76_9CAUD|nr:hypothetical protein KGG88_gp61 [Streptomyces phage Daudau]ATI18762.1 hypothetical protein SEA_DAUDAU_61 [Streptomyces phage Daudau]
MIETLKALNALITQYREGEAERTASLDELRDEDGEPLDGNYAHLDELRFDKALEAQDALDGLLSALETLTGRDLEEGDEVTILADAETTAGGFVGFEGATKGTVKAGPDVDGDILVQADNGLVQFVSPTFLTKG